MSPLLSSRISLRVTSHFAAAIIVGVALMAGGAAHATPYTWDVVPGAVGAGNGTITGGTGTWNTTNGNWTTDGGANNVAWPGSGTDNDAVFGGTAGTVTITAVTVNDIAVNDNDGYVLSGINNLTFNGTTPTITLNKAATLSAPSLGGTLLFAGRLAGSGALTVGSTNNQRWLLNTGSSTNSAYTGDITVNASGIFEPRDTLSSATGNNITVNTSGELRIQFSTSSLGGLNGTGLVQSVSGAATLSLGKNDAPGNFSGTMQNGGTTLSLTKIGNGTQELSGTGITYTGGTTLNGGTLKLTDTTSFNSNVTMTSGTLQLNRTTGTWVLSKTLNTGAASVRKTGAGTVELTGGGNYTGGTTISAGTLYANAVAPGTGLVTLGDANTGTDNVQFDVRNSGLSNAITVANQGTGTAAINYVNVAGGWTQSGGTVTLDRAATMSVPNTTGTIVYNPVLAGSGALTMGTTNGQRFVLIGSSPTYTGDVSVQSDVIFEPRANLSSATGNSFTVNGTGILQIVFADTSIGGLNGGGTVRRIDLGGDGGTRTLTIGKGDAPGSFSGTITQPSGVLALTKTGAGTQTLSGANTYTGLTTVSDGTLSLSGSLTGSSVATSGTGIMSQTAAGSIAGSGVTFTQGSSGTSILDGANTYAGTTTVNNGVLKITGGTSNTTTGITYVSNGELQLGKTGGAYFTSGSTLQIGEGAGGAGTAITRLLADNQTSPSGIDVTIHSDGVLILDSFNEAINSLTDDSSGSSTVDGGSGSGTPTFTVASGDFRGVIQGDLALAKNTAGILDLRHVNNTYSGNTTVTAGTLRLINSSTNNNIASSPVIDVQSGATLNVTGLASSTLDLATGQILKGSGTVQGNVIVGGGIVAPGSSPGLLTINGNQTWSNGDTYQWEAAQAGVAGTDYDSIYVNGILSFTGVSSSGILLDLIKWPGGDIFATDKFALWTYTSLTGWDVGVNASSGLFMVDKGIFHGTPVIYNDGAGTIWLTGIYVPEPSTYALGLVGLVALACRAWAGRRKRQLRIVD